MSVSSPARPYSGRYAELYDLFYSDKPYAEEAAFVHECIREFSNGAAQNVLELACGTGRHALELEKLGYQVTATDRSAAMIDIARRRAAEQDSKIELAAMDMQQLDLPTKIWDAAVCLFDSIGYLKTNEAIAKTFERVRKHLRDGGVFIFEFWHAPAMLNNYSQRRERHWKIDNGEVLRISETTLDRENCLAKVEYTVEEKKADGTSQIFRESHANRFFSVEEMKRLLEKGNLAALKFFAGFNSTAPITDETWHIVAVARKQ
jgi:SAM-dependent methyltransferase